LTIKRIANFTAGILAATLTGGLIRTLWAQTPPAPSITMLYVDQKTGQVFIRPGNGRVPMSVGSALSAEAVAQKVEQKTRAELQQDIAVSQAQQRADTVALQKQVNEIKPAWQSYLDNFQNKFRVGALAYLDYSFYTHTGFGPQFLENENPPGVGNNGFNAFDISRVYLNTYFTPTHDLTFRFTPEIYRANGANQTSTSCLTANEKVCSFNDTFGANTGVGSNLDGDLNLRLKYAYLQYADLWNNFPMLKDATVTFGAQQNPLLGWEEDFTQYRFVYLSPWNYLGLSSSQIGLQTAGPIRFPASEKTYLDYALGAYDNGNFRTQEQTNTKQVMGRLTAYPFGSAFRYQGLGLTGFWNYGWGNTTPDNAGIPTSLKGSNAQFQRIAAILTYATEQWNILGEFDYGKNAFQLGNLFSGSGPSDAFGVPTGTPIMTSSTAEPWLGNSKCAKLPGGTPCYPIFNTYGPQTAAYQAILNNGRTRQLGVDFLGHYHIPDTKLTAFGMFQWLMPNDNVSGVDPLDFQRFVVGLSYQYNEFLRLAVDSQNLLYYHNQMGWGVPTAEKYGYVAGKNFNGWTLPTSIPPRFGGQIPDLVPRDIHSFFLNLEFSY
jgi:hypothetical protein